MKGARGRDRTCQEANFHGVMVPGKYGLEPAPCGQPATCIIDNGDTHPYWMCESCADHNVHNRGAVEWAYHRSRNPPE